MARLRGSRTCLQIVAIAFGFAVLACLLPANPYQRWQLLDGTIHANARWIYERCQFDPTPIDVAFVGPSRTGMGVNAPRLGAALAARGLPSHVVNFSLPEAGRNINYVVVHELLETKHPRIIVLGVTEKPSRFGHPAFKFVAPAGLVTDPGYLTDLNYVSDLAYLPYRQLTLAMADVFPGISGLRKRFDPALYRGPSVDTTGSVRLPDGGIKDGETAASAAELARGVRKLERGSHPPILPARYGDLEFGDERHYLEDIAREANAKGVRIVFLYLPYYGGKSDLQERTFYSRFGPILDARFIGDHAEWYADYGHLTRTGAAHLTDWLVDPIATALRAASVEHGVLRPAPPPAQPSLFPS
jgi:hypothetical protein